MAMCRLVRGGSSTETTPGLRRGSMVGARGAAAEPRSRASQSSSDLEFSHRARERLKATGANRLPRRRGGMVKVAIVICLPFGFLVSVARGMVSKDPNPSAIREGRRRW
jgi:hypothetical protein